jgi:flagellar basal-body rod modification protein FlgD
MSNLAIPSANTAASTTGNSGASSSSSTSSGLGLTQSDFLQLLTAQLQFQNPTSPADPTQLAGEFAEISTVNGIDQLNTSVNNITASAAASQMGQAASLVGKQVGVDGDTLIANSAGSAEGAFSLASAAQNVTVSVVGPSGSAVNTIKLGALPAGQQDFNFTGGTAGTQYTYQVKATSAAGSSVSVTPFSVFTVESVNVSGTTPTLNLEGLANPIAISSIQTVFGGTAS